MLFEGAALHVVFECAALHVVFECAARVLLELWRDPLPSTHSPILSVTAFSISLSSDKIVILILTKDL